MLGELPEDDDGDEDEGGKEERSLEDHADQDVSERRGELEQEMDVPIKEGWSRFRTEGKRKIRRFLNRRKDKTMIT